ncbi:hypothetical protein ABMA28_015281 [Loxostege sticticalis]|uniref:Endonuclease/exonuclease/phosphatase domain-containing protein n=1 Tax=Loxostege sticticalis TaxID=481309 RepID=A0ABD0TEX7_LOXSC
MYISTLNTRTLSTEDRLEELRQALTNLKWDIIGLSEVRRMGDEIREYEDFIFYYHGEKKGMYGVGFIIKKKYRQHIEEFRGISDRIAILDIKLPGIKKPISLIQIYAPTEETIEEEKEKFYQTLHETMEKTHKQKIIIGDFNSKVGTRQEGEELILGCYSSGNRNNNGQRLVNFALEYNLKIMNSFYKKHNKRKWTWISPDGKYKNEIDFVITNMSQHLSNVEVINQLNFSTNHRMVRATFNTKNTTRSRRHFKTGDAKYTTVKISEEMVVKLKESLPEMSLIKTMQEKYDILEKHILDVGKKLSIEKSKKDRVGDEARELMEKRRELILDRKTNIKEIEDISKKITTSIRKHQQLTRIETIRKEIEKTGGIKKALKQLKEHKIWMPSIQRRDNVPTSNRSKISKTATDFYKDLYSIDNCETFDIPPSTTKEEEIVPSILTSETRKAIMSQKNFKAPGEDKITNELLKQLIDVIDEPLTALFNEILYTEQIPTQWTNSTIVLILTTIDQ